MQGMRSGREEFIFAPRGLGINQQSGKRVGAARATSRCSRRASRATHVQGFYTYDAFSPLVLFALERFGYCGIGEAAAFVQDGRIAPGGALPVNTSGGLLSEAHVAGWNSICEMTRQLRGSAGASQIADARVLQWGTAWGDCVILTRERMSMHEKPRPRVGPDNAPFWQGCRAHRLMLPTCTACGKAHLPPGPVCPFCFADAIEWKQASGRGVHQHLDRRAQGLVSGLRGGDALQRDPGRARRRPAAHLEPGRRRDRPSIGQRVEVVFDDVDARADAARVSASIHG